MAAAPDAGSGLGFSVCAGVPVGENARACARAGSHSLARAASKGDLVFVLSNRAEGTLSSSSKQAVSKCNPSSTEMDCDSVDH